MSHHDISAIWMGKVHFNLIPEGPMSFEHTRTSREKRRN